MAIEPKIHVHARGGTLECAERRTVVREHAGWPLQLRTVRGRSIGVSERGIKNIVSFAQGFGASEKTASFLLEPQIHYWRRNLLLALRVYKFIANLDPDRLLFVPVWREGVAYPEGREVHNEVLSVAKEFLSMHFTNVPDVRK